MKISMIGCGKLGLPCAEIMAEQHEVLGYDINRPLVFSKVKFVDTIIEAATDRDMIFVAVPTPHEKGYDGRSETSWLEPKNFDYSIVETVLREINEHINQNTLVVLISTVLPGTVRKHFAPLITRGRFIYNPYLIAMGSVKWDMIHPECLIIGTEDGSETGDAKLLVDFYRPLMKNDPPINIGTWEEAESIKIFYNTWISAKIGLVNMIQDVAESLGHMNVDVVTDALKRATQRITGPKYMTAGMGDGGSCHPRDNIALRWLAKELNLGYDLFKAIMESREHQAYNLAMKLRTLAEENGLPIIIHGRAYKPDVPYLDGSYSELVGEYARGTDFVSTIPVMYSDPMTGDWVADDSVGVILLAHNKMITYGDGQQGWYFKPGKGSIIVDPWRQLGDVTGCRVIHYGNTR